MEYTKFDIRRCFGIELEVSSVQMLQVARSGKVFVDCNGVPHPVIKKEYLKGIIEKVSPRDVVISDWAQTVDNTYWHVKFDHTCGPLGKGKDDGGWEVASFKAHNEQDLLHIAEVAEALKNGGVEVNKNCGLHIHADASDLSHFQVAVIISRWLKIEPWICQMLPPWRKKNKYCKLLRTYYKINHIQDSIIDPLSFWRYIRPSNLEIHENSQKKVAINLVNYTAAMRAERDHYYYDSTTIKRKTLELRLPEGTLNGQDIINWTLLYLLFIELFKNSVLPENYRVERTLDDFLCSLGLYENSSILLSHELYGLKQWILSRMVEWGAPRCVAQAKKRSKKMEI